jgi:nicotinamidase-related amidase
LWRDPRSAFADTPKRSPSADISALVLVDVLNDFLSPEGKINPRIKDQIEKHGFLEKVIRLISGARAAGVQIVYAPHGLHEHSFDDVFEVPVRMKVAMENHLFWEGEFGSDFYQPFYPQSGDIVASRQNMRLSPYVFQDIIHQC